MASTASYVVSNSAPKPGFADRITTACDAIETASGAPRFLLLVAGHLAYTVPLVLKTVGNALSGFDPALAKSLLEFVGDIPPDFFDERPLRRLANF